MKVIPIAFDSLGTRSMATYVETRDLKIFIDPGVSLAPNRFGKPPHPIELEREAEHWESIKRYAKKAKVLTLSHYHYDHHNPNEPGVWKDKIALVKHPTENINKSQKARARFFLRQIEGFYKELDFCDGKTYQFGKTKLVFSKAVPHGQDPKLGYVTMLLIDDGKERFIHTSDVEGPPLKGQTDFILRGNPGIVIIDGPMCWMAYRYPPELTRKSVKNIIKIMRGTEVRWIVLDHHFMRELKWRERIGEVFREEKRLKGRVKVGNAALFLGKKEDLLEASRNNLYKEFPVKGISK